MKDLQTISEHEILNYAWLAVLTKYQREEERAERMGNKALRRKTGSNIQ